MAYNPIPALATLPCASPFIAQHITRSKSEIWRLSLGFVGVHPSHSCAAPLAEISMVEAWAWSLTSFLSTPKTKLFDSCFDSVRIHLSSHSRSPSPQNSWLLSCFRSLTWHFLTTGWITCNRHLRISKTITLAFSCGSSNTRDPAFFACPYANAATPNYLYLFPEKEEINCLPTPNTKRLLTFLLVTVTATTWGWRDSLCIKASDLSHWIWTSLISPAIVIPPWQPNKQENKIQTQCGVTQYKGQKHPLWRQVDLCFNPDSATPRLCVLVFFCCVTHYHEQHWFIIAQFPWIESLGTS